MNDPTDLSRVLAALDGRVERSSLRTVSSIYPDAARLLRAAVDDFHEYANHGMGCPQPGGQSPTCDCGLLAAQERWRTR